MKTLAAIAIAAAALAGAACGPPRGAKPAPADGGAQASPADAGPPARIIVRARKCMGTECTFTAWHHDEEMVDRAFRKGFDEMDRIESLMSTWRETSDVSRLNAAAGGAAVTVSPDTMAVLQKSQWIAEKSHGGFDVTIGAFKGLWKFDEDNDGSLPSPAKVKERRRLVNYRDLELDPAHGTARLRRKHMAVNLGGIAKGYAIDAAVRVIRAEGVADFLAQAGGDLFAAGKRGDRDWKVGIQDPRAPRDVAKSAETSFALLGLSNRAFNTSGDYERFVMKNGKRWHHILDARTGFPASACRSVTILAPDSFLADTLDTAIFIMGPEEGMKLAAETPEVQAVIVTAKNEVLVSPGLRGLLTILRQPTDAP